MKEAREEVEPRRDELLKERDVFTKELEALEKRHEGYIENIPESERKVYESFRSGGRKVIVTAMTADGACGHCFGMIPLQKQNEVRHGAEMLRCEACGVILTSPVDDGEA